MTLQHSYGTNGISDAFAFSFPIDQEADIQVLIDNVEQTSGFTVHGAASPGGGVVVFLAAPSAGKTLVIRHRGRSAVSSADASSGYLSDKLVAGAGISLTAQEDGEGRQVLVLASTDGGNDLDADQNLADLSNKADARNNLDVYAKGEVYTKTEVNTAIAASSDLDLKKAQNLLDVPNKATARSNLDVYAKGEVYTKTEVNTAIADSSDLDLKKAQNLLDVPNKATARSNLDVYAKGDVYTKTEVNTAIADSSDLNLKKAQNLLDVPNKATARTNLGLDNVAYLNVAQDWTQPQRNQALFTGSVGGAVTLDLVAYQNFELELAADINFADPAVTAAMVGQRGSIGIVPNGFSITAMGAMWKRVGDTGAPGEITGQGRIDYHIRSIGRIEYAYNDVEE